MSKEPFALDFDDCGSVLERDVVPDVPIFPCGRAWGWINGLTEDTEECAPLREGTDGRQINPPLGEIPNSKKHSLFGIWSLEFGAYGALNPRRATPEHEMKISRMG